MSTSESGKQSSKTNALRVAIFGVGDAGCGILAHLKKMPRWRPRLVAVNWSPRPPDCHERIRYVRLGEAAAPKLGIGGDPALARAGAEQADANIRDACRGVDLALILAGLGKGTGSGAAPVIARIIRELDLPVFCVASLPYEFEGSMRQRVAANALHLLRMNSNGVACLFNQSISEDTANPLKPADLFTETDEDFVRVIHFIEQVLSGTNFLEIGFNDFTSVFRDGQVEGRFIQVAAEGENRADTVVERMFAHPLISEDEGLSTANKALVHLGGDASLTMPEIQSVMERINAHCRNVDVIFGAAQGEGDSGSLTLSVLFSRGLPLPASAENCSGEELDQVESAEAFKAHLQPDAAPRAFDPFAPPPPRELPAEQKEELLKEQQKKGKLKQTDLPLEIVSRGRFEKSHRTIHRGEDLDVPTFVRKGIKL